MPPHPSSPWPAASSHYLSEDFTRCQTLQAKERGRLPDCLWRLQIEAGMFAYWLSLFEIHDNLPLWNPMQGSWCVLLAKHLITWCTRFWSGLDIKWIKCAIFESSEYIYTYIWISQECCSNTTKILLLPVKKQHTQSSLVMSDDVLTTS